MSDAPRPELDSGTITAVKHGAYARLLGSISNSKRLTVLSALSRLLMEGHTRRGPLVIVDLEGNPIAELWPAEDWRHEGAGELDPDVPALT